MTAKPPSRVDQVNSERRRALLSSASACLCAALPTFRPVNADASELDLGNSTDKSTYYTVQHPSEFDLDYKNALYGRADQMTEETRRLLPHYLNIPFGADPRQRLDLYLPNIKVQGVPVLLFLHGGGFEEGDRAHYGFIAQSYAPRGIIVAVSGYRLASEGHGYPSQPDDAKHAFIWLHRNIVRFGGSSKSMFLSGHSVGAIMTGDLGADREWLTHAGIPREALRGIAPTSGRYDLTHSEDFDPLNGETISAAYVPTKAAQIRASALSHLRDPAPAAVIAYGDGDAYERRFERSSKAMFAALQRKGVDAQLIHLDKQTHIDTVFSFADERSPLFQGVVGMIQKWA